MATVKIGDVFRTSLYNNQPEPVRLLKILPFGTLEVERVSDGRCFRLSGLRFTVKEGTP